MVRGGPGRGPGATFPRCVSNGTGGLTDTSFIGAMARPDRG
jgi:hypothetical protein